MLEFLILGLTVLIIELWFANRRKKKKSQDDFWLR